MTKKNTTKPTPTNPTLSGEALQEFHDEVHELATTVVAASNGVDVAKNQLKDRKTTLEKAQAALAAYINDDTLPLLNGDTGDGFDSE